MVVLLHAKDETMNIRRFRFVCAFAVATAWAWPGASEAGSLSSLDGSIQGYVSGTEKFSVDNIGGNNTISYVRLLNAPATITFSITPGPPPFDQLYQTSFSINGVSVFPIDPETDTTGYINEGGPGSPGATAGGTAQFLVHESSGIGSIAIVDPTGAYIASGGTASPVGVTVKATLSVGGYDIQTATLSDYELRFSTSPLSAVPEPSSVLLLVVGIPAIACWKHRRRARRPD
jgi:hypothetical protein